MFIILSANEAGSVSGPSTETPALAALQPIALTDGRFILGAEVLSDPAHAEHLAFLSTLPLADLATITPLLPVSGVVQMSAADVTPIPPAPSLGARMLSAVKSFFAPDPVG